MLSVAEQELGGNKAVWHNGVADEVALKKLIEDHHKWTGSLRARDILDHWAQSRAKFVKVFPTEYKRALGELAAKTATAAAAAKAAAKTATLEVVAAK